MSPGRAFPMLGTAGVHDGSERVDRGGLALLLVPGIVVALTFFFAGIALIDRDLGVLGAFRESSRFTRGHRRPLFPVLLFFTLVDAALKLPAPPLGPPAVLAANLLSLFVFTPWTAASLMSAYEDLLEFHRPEAPRGENDVPLPILSPPWRR